MRIAKKETAKKSSRHKRVRLIRALTVLVLAVIFFLHVGRVLREEVVRQLSEMTGMEVRAGSVSFGLNGRVIGHDVEIRPRDGADYDDSFLKAELVDAHFSRTSMLLFRPRLKKLVVKNFILDAKYDTDLGRWNLSGFDIKLGDLRGFSDVELKDGILQYSKVSSEEMKICMAVAIEASIDFKREGRCIFGLETAKAETSERSILRGSWESGKLKISGSISSEDTVAFDNAWSVRELDAELKYDKSGNYDLKLMADDLNGRFDSADVNSNIEIGVLEESVAALGSLRRFFSRFNPEGTVDIQFSAEGNFEDIDSGTYDGQITCSDVSIMHSSFRYKLSHLRGAIGINESGTSIHRLLARHGDAKVLIDGWSSGYGISNDYGVDVFFENIALDDDLRGALKGRHQELWDDFSPVGRADIHYMESRADLKKISSCEVDLLGVESSCRYFDYPLSGLTGRLTFGDGGVRLTKVESREGDKVILIDGVVASADKEEPCYDLKIRAAQLPLDGRLSACLSGEFGAGEQFDTGGKIVLDEVDARVWREFGAEGNNYSVRAVGRDVAVGPELLKLAGDYKKTIIRSGLAGTISFEQEYDTSKVDNGRAIALKLQGNGLMPFGKRYPFENVSGVVEIAGGRIVLRDVRGDLAGGIHYNGSCGSVCASGIVDTLSGKSVVDLEVSADSIPVDGKVLGFAGAGKAVDFGEMCSLSIEGGKLRYGGSGLDDAVHFSGLMSLDGSALGGLDIVKDIKVRQRVKADYGVKSGKLKLDGKIEEGSAWFMGMKVDSLRGEVHYDGDSGIFSIDNLTGDVYGGRLLASCRADGLDEGGDYVLSTFLSNVNLDGFVADKSETSDGVKKMRGVLNGSIDMGGKLGESGSNIGTLKLGIRDMRLGRTSLFSKIFSAMKLSESEDHIFSKLLVDGYIRGNEVNFERIDLSGQGAAFEGGGVLDMLSKELNIKLSARGRRNSNGGVGAFQSLTESFGQGVIRMEISGNIQDPEVKMVTLPAIKNAMGIFGSKVDSN